MAVLKSERLIMNLDDTMKMLDELRHRSLCVFCHEMINAVKILFTWTRLTLLPMDEMYCRHAIPMLQSHQDPVQEARSRTNIKAYNPSKGAS